MYIYIYICINRYTIYRFLFALRLTYSLATIQFNSAIQFHMTIIYRAPCGTSACRDRDDLAIVTVPAMPHGEFEFNPRIQVNRRIEMYT